MLRIIILLITAHLIVSTQGQWDSEFCAGWDQGYKQGWCYGQQSGCGEPQVPMCPAPISGEVSYQHGYNRGFVSGQQARQSQSMRGTNGQITTTDPTGGTLYFPSSGPVSYPVYHSNPAYSAEMDAMRAQRKAIRDEDRKRRQEERQMAKDEAVRAQVVTYRLALENGDSYVGQMYFDKYHGQGEYRFKNGSKYIGQFKLGWMEGKGELTLFNGLVYRGDFHRDMRHGNGELIWPDGRRYVGAFRENLQSGPGVLYQVDGSQIWMRCRLGKPYGTATMVTTEGKRVRGEYIDGVFKAK